MKIYLAAWYERNAEMRRYRAELEALGHMVTSRWIDQHGGELTASMPEREIDDNLQGAALYAHKDLEDLNAANVMIFFASPNGEGKGGRHFELGYAIAKQKPIIHIGRRENVFQALPTIAHYDTWPEFLMNDVTFMKLRANGGWDE